MYAEGWKVEVTCPKCGHKMNLATQTIHGEQVDPVYICQFQGETYTVDLSTGDRIGVVLGPCEHRTTPIPLYSVPSGYFRHWRLEGDKPTENTPEREAAERNLFDRKRQYA